jgi:hypothetical protein
MMPSAQTWARVIKRRGAQLYRSRLQDPDAKVEAAKYATHSLRAGTITSLADGWGNIDIRDVTGGGTSTLATTQRY